MTVDEINIPPSDWSLANVALYIRCRTFHPLSPQLLVPPPLIRLAMTLSWFVQLERDLVRHTGATLLGTPSVTKVAGVQAVLLRVLFEAVGFLWPPTE